MRGEKIATANEVKSLLKVAKQLRGGSKAAEADCAMIAIMIGAGLRITEAASLLRRDIDLDAGLLIVVCGKGGKRREVVISDWLQAELKDYLSALKPDDYLFTTKRTRGTVQADSSALHRRVKKLMRLSGCRECMSAHSLRHYFATTNLRQGVSLAGVRDLLGHASISVTSEYLHFVGEDADRARKIRPI